MDEPTSNPVILCPECLGPVQIHSDDAPANIHCPHCGSEFDPSAIQAPAEPNLDRLDADRIRQSSRGRRSLWRSRSYCLIAAITCLAGAGELIGDGVPRVKAHQPIRWLIEFLCAIALLPAAGYFLKLARRYTREARTDQRPINLPPPDFTTLSDGSQQARNLEEIR